ncbi:MAG: transglutaminase-like domain-containing protein [Bacteroidales bacterium]|nr:transglutaminase-like domain-containing protein [Bacteroidales bacterium]
MNIRFVPFCKYDTVIENSDGTITVPPHKKLRYVFCCQDNDNIYIHNNLDGSIYKYDISNESIIQLNCSNKSNFKNFIGFCVYKEMFVFFSSCDNQFVFFNKYNLKKEKSISYNFDVNSFVIQNEKVIIYNRETSEISIFQILTNELNLLSFFSIKGIGNASLSINNNKLFITDSEENIIRCYSFKGELLWEAITPFIDPIGQIWLNNELYILYGGLVNEVGYENRCWQEQKPFFHRFNYKVEEKGNIVLTKSNAFEVTFFYYEPFYESPDFLPATISLSLPLDCVNQKVLSIKPLGANFKIKQENDKKLAFYDICNDFNETVGIGYVANLKLQGIKYTLKDIKSFNLSNVVFLTDDDLYDFDVENYFYDKFKIYGSICDIEKVLKLRNIVFDRLEYRINKNARSYIEIFEDGYGTCGDYTALILAFLYKNNISCRSATGYKIPRFYNCLGGIISVYYNHTWIEIFDKDLNYYPIETSSDDKEYNGRFCEGQFLGLDWSHIKLYNGKAFPNLISIVNKPNIHPFDYFKKAQVYVRVEKETEIF